MTQSVVCFGELMMRLSPPGHERFLQSPEFRTWFGGSEANVALGLAHLGRSSTFVTALPPHAIGDAALASVRGEGVDTRHIVRSGNRIGIYFVEGGADIRPMRVLYDRAYSSFATLEPSAFDWDVILSNAAWLHLSGITPALGDGPARAAQLAATAARRANVRVSLDLNYRPALWTGRDPVPHVLPLAELCDLLIGNAGAVEAMLGVSMPSSKNSHAVSRNSSVADENLDALKKQAAQRIHEVLGVPLVAFTERDSASASQHTWRAVLYDGKSSEFYSSRLWKAEVVDRVGGGDSFAAALIHALLGQKPLSDALEFATAASALKLTIAGDFNRVSTSEVERLLGHS